MKKKSVSIIVAILLYACVASSLSAAPITGIWTGQTTGLGTNFDGYVWVTDPDNDGASIGDEIMARDMSPGSMPGIPYFWGLKEMIRDTLDIGPIVDNNDGTATRSFSTTRSGGTFFIWGDHLWGQDPGSVYTVPIEGEGHGVVHLDWNSVNQNWDFSKYEGLVQYWGQFNNEPFLFDFQSKVLLNSHEYNSYLDMVVFSGTFYDTRIEIGPVPLPTTILLLGTGLVSLASMRRKFKK